MKNLKFLVVLLFIIGAVSSSSEVKAQYYNPSFSTFQRDLSPYGRWSHHPRYGQVWSYNQPGFRPYYSDGHWEYTNYGWEWVSDYDWGWAPFHYGRWEYDPYDGWIWIPDYEWAPAWVSWSSYDGYYGWAPMGYGSSINISFGSIPYDRWTFVPRQNMCERNLNRYYVSPQRNYNFRNAVIINNVYKGHGRDGRFFRGPDRDDVQRYTQRDIQERKVDNREKTGVFRRGDNTINNNNRDQNNNNGNWNNGNRDPRNNRQDNPNVFDRMKQGQQDVKNNDRRDNFPGRQQQQQPQQKESVFDRMNQAQQEKQQRDQQIEQQKRQQQIDEQQRQQQMDQQRRQQQEQQQKQQQIEQQTRQQQEQQQRQQQMDQQRQQRQQQDQQRKQQPVFQGPPIREERKQEINQRSNDNGNQGGFFSKKRGGL